MRYFALDIETSGLNENTCQVLEIAIIDSQSNKQFHCFVDHAVITGDPVALAMNARIIEILAKKPQQYKYVSPKRVCVNLNDWLTLINAPRKINIAGKNVGFDISFLSKLPEFFKVGQTLNLINYKTSARYLDPGILYYKDFDEHLPDLKTCCQRANIEMKGEHNALEDAEMVLKLLQYKGI